MAALESKQGLQLNAAAIDAPLLRACPQVSTVTVMGWNWTGPRGLSNLSGHLIN